MASAGKVWEVRSINRTQKTNLMSFLVTIIFSSTTAKTDDLFSPKNLMSILQSYTSFILLSLTKLTYTE